MGNLNKIKNIYFVVKNCAFCCIKGKIKSSVWMESQQNILIYLISSIVTSSSLVCTVH